MLTLRTALLAGGAAWLVTRAYAALRPTAFPYFARAILEVPRPLLTRRRLIAVLEPAAGEHILEIGPGTGYYTLPVAASLGPDGTLDIVDVRQRFLDNTVERARRSGLTNITPTRGDGASLPYPDHQFDAAYLVTVLGEMADQGAALRELRRVLKPSSRLVIGEILIDPDYPRLRTVAQRARAAGFVLERHAGTPVAYFAKFRRSP